MEKLMELLRKYEIERRKNSCLIKKIPYGNNNDIKKNRFLIISKEYGFIKWVADNDKIDKEFEDKKFLGDIFDSGYRYNDSYIEERLLCYLALTDEPMEFLISILK